MTDDPLDAMKARWNHIQGYLFPWLREEVDPITEALGRLVTTLDVIGLEAFVPEPPRGAGRPPDDRRALARAFVAKAVLGVPTTTALIERLDVDKSLRRILGWERRSQVPSESTFSRAFAEFAQGDLPDKMHAALIERSLGGRIVGVIARDATEIEAREKPVKTEPNDKKEDPPLFTGYGPQASASSLKAMRQKIRELKLRRRTHVRLADIARDINPILQGWLNYYGRYSPAALHSVWRYVNATLIAWAMRKYKRYAGRKIQAGQMIGSIANKRRRLFVHWHQSSIGAFA